MLNRLILALPLLAFSVYPSAAFGDADWPCAQRKVEHLSIGQMWSAATAPEGVRWSDDPVIAALVGRLSARRTQMDEAESLIKDFASEADNQRLALLFQGIFERIERDRYALIGGITSYAQKQRSLAQKIDARQHQITEARKAVNADDYDQLDQIEEWEDQLNWDTRIYDERQKSLTYVCESPVVLEKRAFALAKLIQARLGQ